MGWAGVQPSSPVGVSLSEMGLSPAVVQDIGQCSAHLWKEVFLATHHNHHYPRALLAVKKAKNLLKSALTKHSGHFFGTLLRVALAQFQISALTLH
jgi:hypothetical protein